MNSRVSMDLERPGSVLAVGAHPDDIDFSCGATLAKWAAGGTLIHELICTDGSKGSWEPETDPGELAGARMREQRAAHRALGATGEVVFLPCVDGELENTRPWRAEVCGLIRALRPDVVLGHDPWRRYLLHPDHRQAGFLLIDAVVAARDPLFFTEQRIAPHRVGTLLLWKADEVDHVEDVSGFAEAKVRALLEHRSQYQTTLGIDVDAPWEANHLQVTESVLSRLRQSGALHGLELAETFKRVQLG